MLKKIAFKTKTLKTRAVKSLSAKSPVAGTIVAQSIHIAFQNRKLLFACVAIALGILIGTTAVQSRESLEILSSVFVMGLFVLIALYHPLGGFLLWVFLHTFIDSWVEVPLGRGVPDLSFSRLAVFALAVSLLMRVSTRTMRLVPLSSTDIWAILVPVGYTLSAPLAVQPTAAIQTSISLFLIPLAGFIFAKQFIRKREHLDWLLGVIVLFGTIAGAHAIYESLTGNIIFISKDQIISRVIRGDTNLRLIVGLVGETGSMGRVLALTLLVTLYSIMQDKQSSYLKPFLMIGVLLQFGGLVVTFSRTPLLTFLVGLFILQFFYPSLRKLLIVLALIVGVTMAVNWERIQRTEAAQDRLSGVQDYNGRSSRWQTGLNMWLDKPVRGWGMGRLEQVSGRYRSDGSRAGIDAVENDYLHLLINAGLVGFLPFALFLLTVSVSSLRLFWQRRNLGPPSFLQPGTIALGWAVIACFGLYSFTAINSQSITRLLPFVLMGALIGSHQYLLASESKRKWSLSGTAASVTAHMPRG